MPILTLMKRVNQKYANQSHPFINKNIALRRAYLTGVAMLAHADGDVDADERSLFLSMAGALEISEEMAASILNRAGESGEETVLEIREHLYQSKYKYYFIVDLLLMAHQDQELKPVEDEVIRKFCELLGVEERDLQFLSDLAEALIEKDPEAKDRWTKEFFASMRMDPNPKPNDFLFYTSDDNFKA